MYLEIQKLLKISTEKLWICEILWTESQNDGKSEVKHGNTYHPRHGFFGIADVFVNDLFVFEIKKYKKNMEYEPTDFQEIYFFFTFSWMSACRRFQKWKFEF